MEVGVINFEDKTNTYYIFNMKKPKKIMISDEQQSIFTKEMVSNLVKYVEENSKAYVIFDSSYTVYPQSSTHTFCLKPLEIEKLEELKNAMEIIHGRTGPVSYQFTDSITYGKEVCILFDDFGIHKDITDRSNPLIY